MDVSPVIKSVLAGSLSGTCSTVLFQPLDLLKTRIQSPLMLKHGSVSGGPVLTGSSPSVPVPAAAAALTRGSIRHENMLMILTSIVRTERISGLWRGMAPSMMRCVPGVGIYFGSIHWLRSNLSAAPGHQLEPLHPLESVAIGATARSVSATLLIPFTVIKTRFESRYYGYTSVLEAMSKIYREEGGRGLTRGLLATILRDAPFSGCYLMFYTTTKKLIPKDVLYSGYQQPVAHFSCGIIAGILASTVTQPADVIKTKMQLFPDKFANIRQAIVYVHQTYGMSGYFKGIVPRCVRRSLMAAMAWTVYEQLSRVLGLANIS